MRQYELRWAELPAPAGRRPVLLLTRTQAYRYLNRVLVAEVTRTARAIPQEIRVGAREGLPLPSVANFDNIRVVPKALLGDRIGALAPAREVEVKRALGFTLGWPELISLGAP